MIKPTQKPLAFVDKHGFVIPNPTFTDHSIRYMQEGRFIYTATEFKRAVEEMNVRQDERRKLADEHFGADAVLMDANYDNIDDEIDRLSGTRETVPSLSASPKRPRKTEGKSQKLTQPNLAPLPETLNEPQHGVGLTDEEREDLHGIDTAAAVQAMFGQ